MNELGKASPVDPAKDINVFVAAHTNVGKTALLRTLLGRDVGIVEDAPDVTTTTTLHDLVVHPDGGALLIWDTPGFGDSFRLARRFRLRYRWWAWVVREIWDRRRNPSLWRAQRLALDMHKRADVVLYPVSLLERPIDAVYVAPELEVLAWVGKPVLVILNQGALLNEEDAASRTDEWRTALAAHQTVKSVIDLDAFKRCWLQELKLFKEIGGLLPDALSQRYQQFADSLEQAHVERFEASVAAISDYLAQIASDKVEVDTRWYSGVTDALDLLRDKLPWGKSEERRPMETAMETLAQRFAERAKDLANQLVTINRLDGVSSAEVLQVAAEQLSVDSPLNTAKTSLVGSVVSGVLTGLTADLMSGGLTLGTGALVGGTLGALGGAAISQGYNVLKSKDKKVLRWSPRSLGEALTNVVLLYLSVAHFGRGQGTWQKKEVPQHWSTVVDQVLKAYQDELNQLWGTDTRETNEQQEALALVQLVGNVLRDVLMRLYPEDCGVLRARNHLHVRGEDRPSQ